VLILAVHAQSVKLFRMLHLGPVLYSEQEDKYHCGKPY